MELEARERERNDKNSLLKAKDWDSPKTPFDGPPFFGFFLHFGTSNFCQKSIRFQLVHVVEAVRFVDL